MPDDFENFDDWDHCVRTMTDEEGHDEATAEDICGALQQESKSDHGDPGELLDALERGAGLIADVGVDLVSGVDVPAVDSKWVMLKSDEDGHDYRVNTPVLLSKDDDSEKRISYAAAMIPREPDKEGDVVSTPTVEKAAHDFLKQDGGVDTDHSLIDGEGEVVESWVLKQERTFDLPGGATESYGAGTWMVGIKWGADAWSRIQNGELTGLSIYGMAEHVPLGKSVETCPSCGDSLTTTKRQSGDTDKGEASEPEGMGDESTEKETGGDASGGYAPDIGTVAASVNDLADTVTSIEDTLKDLEPAETEKGAREAAAEIAEELGFEGPGAVMDALDAAKSNDDEEDDEDEEEKADADSEASEGGAGDVEKRADDAHLGKGGDGRETAAKQHDADSGSSGLPSYSAAAEKHNAED